MHYDIFTNHKPLPVQTGTGNVWRWNIHWSSNKLWSSNMLEHQTCFQEQTKCLTMFDQNMFDIFCILSNTINLYPTQSIKDRGKMGKCLLTKDFLSGQGLSNPSNLRHIPSKLAHVSRAYPNSASWNNYRYDYNINGDAYTS